MNQQELETMNEGSMLELRNFSTNPMLKGKNSLDNLEQTYTEEQVETYIKSIE